MRAPDRLQPLIARVAVDAAHPTVDEAELAGMMFGSRNPALATWVEKVMKAEDARWDPTTGVAYLGADPYALVGVEMASGVVVGSITDDRVENVDRRDLIACLRAFEEGYTALIPTDRLPAAVLGSAAMVAAAAPAPAPAPAPQEAAPAAPAAAPQALDLPTEGATILVEVDPTDQTAVLDVWAMVRRGDSADVWRRHAGQWLADPGFLSAVGSSIPKMIRFEPDDPTIINVVSQVDAATKEIPFEPTPMAASASAEETAAFAVALLPLMGSLAHQRVDTDSWTALVARGTRGGLAKRSGVGKGGNAETLRQYWSTGKGAAKIRWGVGGDWYRCVKQLKKYMGVRAKGYCQNLHIRTLGYSTSKHRQMLGGKHG